MTLPTFEDQTRQRLEKQLVLDPRLALEAGLDRHLRDVALIGCDVLFADGAALGVVLEASDPAAAEAIIQAQRAVAQKQPDVNADAWTLNGRKLHRLATANHQIRSYLVIDGDFLLVTNSEYIARRFLQQGREKQSLGTLPEFRYARLKHPADADDAAFIYVSDPFFRNVVSPHYRIEMQRRAQAASDLRQLRVAYVAALAEGAPTDRIDDLVRGGFLPEDFGARPDGSYAAYRRGHVADSLRGAACTFLPVPDVPLDKVTPTEWESYRRFTEGYLRQWRLMDPVSVAIARGKRVDRREQIALDVCITPYAREHYAELSRSLARRRDREVAAHDDDLISINAAVNSEGAQRNVYGGLRDRPIDFEYSLGEVRPLGAQDGLGKSQFYLAMYPGNTNALKAVGSIFGERQPATTRTGAANLPTAWFRGGPVGLAAWGLQTVGSPFQMFKLMGLAERIEIRDLWLVMGSEKKFRDELFSTLELRRAASLPMVRFAMGDIARADAYPYVRAHTYLTARKASAQNAQFLNRLSGQLSARPDHMLRVATYLHDAQPICPLAGEYAKKAVAHGPAIWTGTNWSAPSLYNETSVPAAYEFAFLQWLRGMNVDFNLDNTTLRAQVQLEVEHP